MRTLFLPTPLELLWATTGVILTVVGTLLQLSLPDSVPWLGGYRFSFQLGGVFLTACLGGPTAGVYAQVVYLALGLTGMQVFSYGGGVSYLAQPAFGYLAGFVPAAWLCGQIAFYGRAGGKQLGLATALGLMVLHLTGISFLLVQSLPGEDLLNLIGRYSGYPLLGQVLVCLTVVLLALIYRRLTFS